MRTKRTTVETRFQCEECGTTVLPISYRAQCPECAGPLRRQTPSVGN